MKKADLIQHLITTMKIQCERNELIRSLQSEAAKRNNELNRVRDLQKFWRSKAFEFQSQVNDLMGIIGPRDDV
jgi:hypothetical protein